MGTKSEPRHHMYENCGRAQVSGHRNQVEPSRNQGSTCTKMLAGLRYQATGTKWNQVGTKSEPRHLMYENAGRKKVFLHPPQVASNY